VSTQRRNTTYRLVLIFGRFILYLNIITMPACGTSQQLHPSRTHPTRTCRTGMPENLSSNCLPPASRTRSDSRLILPILVLTFLIVCLQLHVLAQTFDRSPRYSPLRIFECSHFNRMADTPMMLERSVLVLEGMS
jgi:hypothetical protein